MSDPMQKRGPSWEQVVIAGPSENERIYQLLIDCAQHPDIAAGVRTIVFQPWEYKRAYNFLTGKPDPIKLPSATRDAAQEALFSQALDVLKVSAERELWMKALMWMEPQAVMSRDAETKDEQHGIYGTGKPYGPWDFSFSLHAAMFLLMICPNVEHLAYNVTASGDFNLFLHNNNYGRLPKQHLQNLRHVTALPAPFLYGSYVSTSALGLALTFHRLPRLESFSIRTVEDRQEYTETCVPHISSLKSLSIIRSDLNSTTIAAFVRLPRALESFTYEAGGSYSHDGTYNIIVPKTLARALWTQRHSLKEIDIDCDSRIHVGPGGGSTSDYEDAISASEASLEQLAETKLDRELESGGPNPLCPSKLDDPPEYVGMIGSLRDYASLERLSVGVRSLPGELPPAAGLQLKDDRLVRYYDQARSSEVRLRLIDALPLSLQHLRIRGYKKGEDPYVDDQINELLSLKASKLPNLRIVEGVEEYIVSNANMSRRKPMNPHRPKVALTSYFQFMQAEKPSIRQNNPDWTNQQVSEEIERLWSTISAERKAKFDLDYEIDLARYYQQVDEFDDGKPVRDISLEEAKELHQRYRRLGRGMGRRAGREILTQAVLAGKDLDADPDIVAHAIKVQEDERQRVSKRAEQEKIATEGPKYEWIEAGEIEQVTAALSEARV